MTNEQMNDSPVPPRYSSQYPTRQVRAKSREVVDYHYDDQKPGKPLWLLIPGALVALASLGLIIWLVILAGNKSIDRSLATFFIIGLAIFYIGGVFIFSYGYELYDLGKAIRLTAIIVFITFAAVFMFAVVLAVLGALSSGKSRSSSSSSSSSSSGGGSSGGGIGGFFRGGSPIFINSGMPNITINRETVRQVPVAPPAPEPIACAFCSRPYLPEENKFACPNCGAPAPKDN